MDTEIVRIWKLIGALSDAHWRRAAQPGGSAFHALFADPYRPESAEEREIWSELTAPHNYLSLRRFVESQNASGTNEFADKLNQALLAEATSRSERQTASQEKEDKREDTR